MKGQELEPCRFDMGLELVELHTVAVVNIYVFLLRYCEMRMVMEEPARGVSLSRRGMRTY